MRLTRSFIRDDCERRSEKSMAVSGRGTIPGQPTHVTQVNSGVISFPSILIQSRWTVTDPGPRRRLWSGRRAAAAGSGWTLIHVEYTTHCQRGGEQHRTAFLTPQNIMWSSTAALFTLLLEIELQVINQPADYLLNRSFEDWNMPIRDPRHRQILCFVQNWLSTSRRSITDVY